MDDRRPMNEIKKSEVGVTDRLKLLDLIFKHTLDSVVLMDKNFNFIRVSESYARSCQRDPSEFPGKNHFEMYPSSFEEEIRPYVKEKRIYKRSGRPFVFPDHPEWGTTYWNLELVPILNTEEEVEFLLFTLKDVTEQKRVELEREQSLSVLRATLESTADAILVLDLNSKIITFNQKFIQLWKIPDFVISLRDGNEVLAFVRNLTKDPEPFYKKVSELQAHPDNQGLDQIELIDGRVIECYTVPQRIEGKSVGRVLSFRDITERKRTELERLRNEKLESLGLLAGGIAHDFNNILTAIMGNISLAKMAADAQGSISTILGEAEKASLRARELANQLLTFAKGGAPNRKSDSIIEILMESSEFNLRSSNVRPKFVIKEHLWPVEIDEGQISQVIQNLVINAQQAMPGGGMIEIRAENVQITPEKREAPFLKEGAYIKIQIKDAGMGISSSDIQKIFDPYFTTKREGSGLGLSISYSIVKRHAGYILVNSEPARGATFTVFLPAFPNRLFREKIDEESPVMGKGHVLIMDDEEPVRNVGREILKYLGYEAECASDGREAVEIYRRAKESGRSFDLVVLDMTVPGGMNGQEVLKELIKINPAVKAVISSGYSNSPVMSEYQKHGFVGIILKPYRIRDFSQVLALAMNQNRRS